MSHTHLFNKAQITCYSMKTYIAIRASLVVPGFASASRNEEWPPSGMQTQTQAKLPLILHIVQPKHRLVASQTELVT